MVRSYDRAVDAVRAVYDRRISGPPILDLAQDFPAGRALVDAWPALRDEAQAVARNLKSVPRFHEIMPEQASISANDGRDWRMYILKAYGVEQKAHLEACPILVALIDGKPDILSASFSFLGPHKHIPPHRGPMRGIIRLYMMLSMPHLEDGRPGAVLTIAKTDHRLEDGQYLLWDDTFEHEARNECDLVRIVLSLDIWRHGMPI